MISISQSTLNIYLNCRRCFWLLFNKGIGRPEGIKSSLPNKMDRIIKGYFDKYRIEGTLPPVIAGKIKGKLAKIPLNLKFEDSKNDLSITGKLDECLELEGGIFIPLDHKTKGDLPGGEEYSKKYYKLQMDTYTLLLKANRYHTDNFGYIVYYSPARGDILKGIPFETEIHKIETEPERAYQIFIEARNSLKGPLPGPGQNCQYCAWAGKLTAQR